MLNIMETKLLMIESSVKVKKRVMNVLIESLQNLYHHSEITLNMNGSEMKKMSGKLLITKGGGWYSVSVGNFISNNAAIELQQRIDEVNAMTKTELDEQYQKVLSNGVMSKKGGGGLGVMDMARRSGEKLEFDFAPVDNENSFFSLNVKIKQ